MEFELLDDGEDIKDGIDAVDFWGSGQERNTGMAVREVRKEFFDDGGEQPKDIAVLMTDGTAQSNSRLRSEAVKLKDDKDVRIIVIGVGDGVEDDVLLDVASEADDFFKVESYDDLDATLANTVLWRMGCDCEEEGDSDEVQDTSKCANSKHQNQTLFTL